MIAIVKWRILALTPAKHPADDAKKKAAGFLSPVSPLPNDRSRLTLGKKTPNRPRWLFNFRNEKRPGASKSSGFYASVIGVGSRDALD
jgi:hypothetical protein